MKPIDVNERLPDILHPVYSAAARPRLLASEWVLAFDGSRRAGRSEWCVARRVGHPEVKSWWEDEHKCEVWKVTHWMPLSPAPGSLPLSPASQQEA